MGQGRKTLEPIAVGQIFGRFTVLVGGILIPAQNGQRRNSCALVECSCADRTRKYVKEIELKRGRNLSCGCTRIEHAQTVNIRHGETNTPMHHLWCHTKDKLKNNLYYIELGTQMCDRWLYSYENFRDDVLREIGPRPSGKWFDRVDNNGDYVQGNVKWSTPTESARNRRNGRQYNLDKFYMDLPPGTIVGKLTVLDHGVREARNGRGFDIWTTVQCACAEEKIFIVKYSNIKCEHTTSCGCSRIKNLQTGSAANQATAKKTEGLTARDIANQIGTTPQVVTNRLKRGWSIERILATSVNNYNEQLVVGGDSHTYPEWAEITGVDAKTMRMRQSRGASPEEIIAPVNEAVQYNIHGESRTIHEWAKHTNQPAWSIYQRFNRDGWSVEEAVFGKKNIVAVNE